MKKIIVFLVDSLMPDVLESCLAKGMTPALQFLIKNGQWIRDCVTVFPTMTASVDCSLITGVYPDQHNVPGLVWYDPVERKVVNYLNNWGAVFKIGVDQCAQNVLYDLNEKHLSKKVKTIHEELEGQGYTSGSINVVAHRGMYRYSLDIPFLMNAAIGYGSEEKVSGPSVFSMGTFVKPAIFREVPWDWSQSAASFYGLNDAYAISLLLEVIRSGKQPDLTICYLPDNDHKLHVRPHLAEQHLAEVDQELTRFLDGFDSWNQALEQNVIIVISDHGQTIVKETTDASIPVDDMLAPLRVHRLSGMVLEEDEVVVCNNERMVYLYPLKQSVRQRVLNAVSGDPRIDVIAWKESDWVHVRKGGSSATLRYKKGGKSRDGYGQSWTLEGDAKILDLTLGADGSVSYGDYPDGLSRLYGALYSQETDVIVITAAPGYQFTSEGSPNHTGGGSHGSLHKQDSLIPLIIAGTSAQMVQPARLVDLKAFIWKVLRAGKPVSVSP